MKKLLLLVLSIVCICVAMIVVSSSQERKTRVLTQQEREEKRRERGRYAREVYRGLLSDKDKIPDLVAKWDRDLQLTTYIGLPLLTPFATPPTAQQVLHARSCDADAVVIGAVRSQTSRLTEDETFIYTVNEMEVTTVLKDNVAQPIKAGDHINVLRTGGAVEVQGRKVTAVYLASLGLETDRTYLLFVLFVPEKGVYVADSISHELRNDKIVSLRNGDYSERELKTGNDATSYVVLVRNAVAAPCDD